MTNFDRFKQGAASLADAAVKTGSTLYGKGKTQINLLSLETKLSKAQRQLGALVYSLHKSGETNDTLVQRYLLAIEAIEGQIAAETAKNKPAAAMPGGVATVLCPQCGAEVDPNAIFCPGCGNKLA